MNLESEQKKKEKNLSISRINPVGLRILSLRGCTAACIVKVGFEGSCGGLVSRVGLKSWGLDNGSEVKACCMHCVSGFVGFFLGVLCGVACDPCTLCRMAMGDIEPACCLPSDVDVGRCPPPAAHLAMGMPNTRTHSGLHQHVHKPTAIVLPCLPS